MALSKVRKPLEQYAPQEEAFVLSNMLQRILDTTVELYAQAGVPLPDRRYWMLGNEVPEDCEQVVVTFVQSYLGLPGARESDMQNCNEMTTGVFNIFVTREHPVGESARPVPPEKVISDSMWGAADARILMGGVPDYAVYSDGFPGPGAIATVNVSPPNGGVQTTILNLVVTIT